MSEDFIPTSVKSKRKRVPKVVKKPEGKKYTNKHTMRLLFKERCPAVPDIRRLHPKIKSVFIPKRPASIRYCVLSFNSDGAMQEVHAALHRKHVAPYRGILRCIPTDSNTLSNIKRSNPELIREYMTEVDIKHAKFVHNKKLGATADVIYNSTDRELFVRYGISPSREVKNGVTNSEILDVTEIKEESSDSESDESVNES